LYVLFRAKFFRTHKDLPVPTPMALWSKSSQMFRVNFKNELAEIFIIAKHGFLHTKNSIS